MKQYQTNSQSQPTTSTPTVDSLKQEIELLKKTIADEVKEKYSLYKRVKELNDEVEKLKKRQFHLDLML